MRCLNRNACEKLESYHNEIVQYYDRTQRSQDEAIETAARLFNKSLETDLESDNAHVELAMDMVSTVPELVTRQQERLLCSAKEIAELLPLVCRTCPLSGVDLSILQ